MSGSRFSHYSRILAKMIIEKVEEAILEKLRLRKRIEFIFELINREPSEFRTYSNYLFQKQPAMKNFVFELNHNPRTLILMQGPVGKEGIFEKRTITHYLNINPQQEILVSTWSDSNSKKLQLDLKEYKNVNFLFNVEPQLAGPSNINYQITNTRNGLIWSEENSFEFTVKTRTDQCMMHPGALLNLHTLFIEHEELPNSKILINSLNTFFFRPYGASDMFQFGKTSDLLKYWSAPLDSRHPSEYSLNINGSSLRNIAQRGFTETYLGMFYLKAVGIEPTFELEQSLEFITKYFVVIDMNATEMVWNKYSFCSNRWQNELMYRPYQEINYAIWLSLKQGTLKTSGLDRLLDLPVIGRDFVYE